MWCCVLRVNFHCRYLVLDIADNPVENIIRFFPMVSTWIGREFSELTNPNFTFGMLSLRHLEMLPALDFVVDTLISVINSFLQVWKRVEL